MWDNVESVIIVFSDVKDKVKVQDLEKQNKAKDKLMGYVIHDFKNPISGVLTFIGEI